MYEASIVVLTIDQYRFTADCVASIRRENKNKVEIILIDNGTDKKCASLELDQYHWFGENLGYSVPCNLGAGFARSEKVVFLNNDTIVMSGWLEPLLSALDNEDVAVVGSKLLYPDGSIQHAGAYFKEVNGKLEGFHWHTEQPPGFVPAVTAACMAVKREHFFNLDGFDSRYWVGNEDMHFCLKTCEMGKKVYYEPKSVVTHFESQSNEHRWQKVSENVEVFTKEWLHRRDLWEEACYNQPDDR